MGLLFYKDNNISRKCLIEKKNICIAGNTVVQSNYNGNQLDQEIELKTNICKLERKNNVYSDIVNSFSDIFNLSS